MAYKPSSWGLRVDELPLKKDEEVADQEKQQIEGAPADLNHWGSTAEQRIFFSFISGKSLFFVEL